MKPADRRWYRDGRYAREVLAHERQSGYVARVRWRGGMVGTKFIDDEPKWNYCLPWPGNFVAVGEVLTEEKAAAIRADYEQFRAWMGVD